MKLGMWIGSNVNNMHAQHLGCYLKGQGHIMILQQNQVQPITSLFEVPFKLFHSNYHHIETPCCKQHLGRYLECQGHSMALQQKRARAITLLFEVWFYNYLTEMIAIIIKMRCHYLAHCLDPVITYKVLKVRFIKL